MATPKAGRPLQGQVNYGPFMLKEPECGGLHPIDEQINHLIADMRSRAEHPFWVLKRQSSYIKTRYRGLAKNQTQLLSLFAIGNFYLL
jgi:IS5 family transposase